jgi:hypothetical protein
LPNNAALCFYFQDTGLVFFFAFIVTNHCAHPLCLRQVGLGSTLRLGYSIGCDPSDIGYITFIFPFWKGLLQIGRAGSNLSSF